MQASQRIVLKGVPEFTMIYQVILNLRRFVAKMQRKTKFDSPPILRFVKIINLYPSTMQAMGQAGEGSRAQNIIDLIKNLNKCLL